MWLAIKTWLAKYRLLLTVGVFLTTFAGGAYLGHRVAEASFLGAQLAQTEAVNRAFLREVERHNDVVSKLESDLTKARKQTRVITKEVIREVARPEYQCPVPVSGVRLLNASRDRPPARSFGSDAAVPAAPSAP